MAVEVGLPTIATVLITGAVDAINPCAIGVMILLISMLVVYKDKTRLLKVGLVYIGSLYATYFLAGIGLTFGLNLVPLAIAEYISIAVAFLVVGAGLIEIKDFFWYGRGISLGIPPERAKQITEYTKNLSLPGIAFLGAFVAGVELPCTGGPYLAIITILSQNFNLTAVFLLAVYNIIFVLPLLALLVLAYTGTKTHILKRWKQKYRGLMRLGIGVLLVFLGWLLMLIANGTVNLG